MPGPARPPLARHPRPAAAAASRIVAAVGFALFALLVAGIVLYIFEVDPSNSVVELVLDVAGWFGAPFEGLFEADDDKTQIVYDWGPAALVYALAAVVIAALIDRAGRIGH